MPTFSSGQVPAAGDLIRRCYQASNAGKDDKDDTSGDPLETSDGLVVPRLIAAKRMIKKLV